MSTIDTPPEAAEKPAPPADDTRLRQGLETTLLAWIRTGMALMGFGFVVARFALFLRELAAAGHLRLRGHATTSASLYFGIAFIVLGVAVCLAAGWLNWRYVRKHPPTGPELPATMPLGLVLSGLVAVVGIGMGVYLAILGS
jgi:putative membrane protein